MYTNRNSGKTDLRVRRTRKMLWEALVKLLEERPFEALSVQEICDRAMVHRTTFYKHFEDKYQLLSYGLEEARERFADRSYEDRILHPIQMFEEFGDMRQFHALATSDRECSSMNSMIQKHACDSLREDLLEAESRGARFPVPVDIIAAFYSGAVSSLGSWWLKNDSSVSAKEMDEYLGRLINKDAFFPNESPKK